ncbi:MAG: Rieske (2Fe-2S) protein [Methanolobus sp.]|uniref:Rieske (2Fe-2S) protein n=1 Tax=Methanolobus sp. TaxID=1874737 RepID=UPI0027300A4A|nr:Rieske (2Fe-2S) protein [Methanolobus sp.]MDP2217368.1 Rieske (2Fe-2S) protein [Methanolobus sp.]
MVPWFLAINESDLDDGEKKPLLLEGTKMLLVRQESSFYALSNICPHMNCPLSKGILDEYVIQCLCHDWRFDIRNGEFLDAKEIKIDSYETKVTDGKVYVNIEK